MAEHTKATRYYFLYVNKHDCFKQNIENIFGCFLESCKCVLADAPTFILIGVPIACLRLVASAIKEIISYTSRVLLRNNKLLLTHVKISAEEEESSLELLDKITYSGKTNVSLSDMERTKLILKNDVYKDIRDDIAQQAKELRDILISNGNRLSFSLIDFPSFKGNIKLLFEKEKFLRITFQSHRVNQLIDLICNSMLRCKKDKPYLTVSFNDLILITKRLRKVMINDLIILKHSQP